MIPDVVGKPGEELDLITAMRSLQEKGLNAKIQLKHSSMFKKGTVMDQRPRAGSISKTGRQVLLTISQGPVVSSVGDYVGKKIEYVKLELQELFSGDLEPVIKIKEPLMYVFDEALPETIIAQNPEPGTEIRESEVSLLELVLSKGPQVAQKKAPSLLFRPYETVIEELLKDEIPFTFVVRAVEDEEDPGIVLDQKPAPGDDVEVGTVMEITITEPDNIEEGMVFGLFEAELVKYPILVDVRLEVKLKDEVRTILEMRHPGGKLGIPYVIPEEAEVKLYINNQLWRR